MTRPCAQPTHIQAAPDPLNPRVSQCYVQGRRRSDPIDKSQKQLKLKMMLRKGGMCGGTP